MCEQKDELWESYRSCEDPRTSLHLSWLLQLRHFGNLAALALTRELDDHGRRHLGYLLEIIERRAGQLRSSVAGSGSISLELRKVA